MSRVAQAGLTYDRFHVTALCSPTRAAMLTGRNHHSVGFGSIGELPGPFPGYTAARPKDCAPFVRMLQGNGYSTAGFGKWHMTPDHVQGAAGPFDRWPNAWGFDHFWGFLGGEAGQYDPVITQDNTIIGVPEGQEGREYYLPDDMTDKAVSWLHAVRAQDPAKPWFVYYSTGCSHAPHQVPAEWSQKYRGRFDARLGRLPRADLRPAKAARRDPARRRAHPAPGRLPGLGLAIGGARRSSTPGRWRSTPATRRTPTGTSGRLLDAIGEMGELDDTLVLYIWGDNGASMEGTITGSFNELTMQNGIPLTPAQQLSLIDHYGGLDAWGTDAIAPHYAARLGLGRQLSLPVGQAGRQPPGRHTQRHGRGLAAPHHRRRRQPRPVHALHRHRPDDPGSGRDPRGQGRRRRGAEADGGHQLPVHLRRRRRGRAAHPAVLRDLRQPRHVQGRLVGLRHARPHPLGRHRRRPSPGSHPASTTPSRTPGSCTTCPTTSHKPATSPPTTRANSPS